jgi:hypothetical protein
MCSSTRSPGAAKITGVIPHHIATSHGMHPDLAIRPLADDSLAAVLSHSRCTEDCGPRRESPPVALQVPLGESFFIL